jgi:CRISPR system Cascade subunit CasB
MIAVSETSNRPADASAVREPAVIAWFNELQKNAGARARLRRCRSTVEALAEPAAISLARRVGALSERSRSDEHAVQTAIDLARVLAHVTTHVGGQRVMQSAGWKQFPGDKREGDAGEMRPVLSEVRFRRLLTTSDGEPLVAAFVRLVRLLNGAVNVRELANDFRFWGHPEVGLKIRQKWAFDYYAAGASAPPDETSTNTNEDDEL